MKRLSSSLIVLSHLIGGYHPHLVCGSSRRNSGAPSGQGGCNFVTVAPLRYYIKRTLMFRSGSGLLLAASTFMSAALPSMAAADEAQSESWRLFIADHSL